MSFKHNVNISFFKILKINMDNGYMEAGMSTIPFIGELKYNYGYSSI